jgi:hypothetical protein
VDAAASATSGERADILTACNRNKNETSHSFKFIIRK